MATEEAALAACTEVLPGLDSDIFEYIVGLLGDFSPSDDDPHSETMQATIAEFLVETEYCGADEASSKASSLLQRLGLQSTSQVNGDIPQSVSVTVQTAALTLDSTPAKPRIIPPLPPLKSDDEVPTSSPEVATPRETFNISKSTSKSTGREGRKPKTTKSKQTAAERAVAQAMEIESELHAARVAAVQARTKQGAYKGSLDATSFTLPNPGGGIPLLEDAACTLVWGRIYGLIGRNGTGKSTMLRALASRRVGNVPANVTVHYVSQEVNLTPEQSTKRPVECILEADIERTLLLDELAAIEHSAYAGTLDAKGSQRHAQVLSRLDEIGSDSAERRAQELLVHLGFSDELQQKSLVQLSGGWRVRVMLAAALFAAPDLLLLDEPTNHLSILAVMWLARELSTSETWKSRIVVIVSHDRHFMDEVCTDCLHISGAAKRLTQSKGNYSQWAKQRRDQQALFAKQQAGRQEEIDKLREYAGHGFKYGGSASQINKMGMKAKQADKLEEIQAEHANELAALEEDLELPMKIESGGELDGFVVQLLNVGFGYPNSSPPRLFENCEFGITSKSRIVLLGENGNGKTTLLKLIMGELEPCEGEVRRSPHARYAKVDQHHANQIDLSMTPLQFLARQFPGDGSNEHMQVLRGHLSSCGVTSGSSNNKLVPDLQNTPASALSGGQRSRVALASVSFAKPHVLVLDEPTNNLDLESVEALAESVQKFNGAVVCVSHDQFFVQAVANEAWVVAGGRVKQVASFEAYRSKQLQRLSKNPMM